MDRYSHILTVDGSTVDVYDDDDIYIVSFFLFWKKKQFINICDTFLKSCFYVLFWASEFHYRWWVHIVHNDLQFLTNSPIQ